MSIPDGSFDDLSFRLGAQFYATAAILSGIVQIVSGHFVRIVPVAAQSPPSHWARLAGVALVAAGVAILLGERASFPSPGSRRSGSVGKVPARVVGASLLGILLAAALALRVPPLLERPLVGFLWTAPLKCLALLGGALLLARGAAAAHAKIARAFLASFLIVGGLQHFAYLEFVRELVPAWIPGRAHWARFTGVALVAGGLGLFPRSTRRIASRAVAVMIFLWVLLLHVPRALSDLGDRGETSGVFEALAISGVALMVSGARGLSPRD